MSVTIISIIEKKPITVVQLIENFKQFREDEALEVLNWLFEINQVEERDGLLYLNSKLVK